MKKKINRILPQINGLGDVVHIFARPIAAAADKTLGTSLLNCGGCAKRREKLNKKIPL